MKILLSLCIAFLCSFSAMAQDAASWSAPMSVVSYRVRDLLFFKDHGYVLRVNGDGFVYSKKNKSLLQQFDNLLGFKKELDIKLTYEGEKAEPIKMLAINDKLYLLYTGYADKEKRLLLSEIDTDNLNFTGEPIVLGTVKSTRSQILMEQSKNGLFFSVVGYWGEDSKSKAYVACYDNNFQLVYEGQQDINLRYSYNACTQLIVDNEGNTFAIMEERIAFAADGPPMLWQKYKTGESIVRSVKTKNSTSNIGKAKMLVSDEVVLVTTYFTEQDSKDDRVKGMAFMAYDKAAKGDAKQAEVFAPRNISKYLAKTTHKKYKESEVEIPALNIVEIKDWEGHGYLVVAERPYLNSPNNGVYIANAIAFVSLVDYSLTKVEWTVPVFKYVGSGFTSQGLFIALEKNKAHVFFNSEDKHNKKHDEANLYGDGLIGMTINPEGKHNTRVLCPQVDNMNVQLKYFRPIDGKSLFILAGQTFKEKVGILRP